MQEINWGYFNAKFNGKQQLTFQWLCNLLFCIEHDQKLGIARYENHAGIETSPIQVGDDWVGWQAKYYDTKLSEHKADLISTIDTAKTRHPEITKLVFYLNKDFGQDKKKTDPKYKSEVEGHAKNKGITVEWRGAWYFESPFVTQENASLVRYFFSLDKSIIDLVAELDQHSESILSPIRSKIVFDGKDVKIDRTGIASQLIAAVSEALPVVLSGEGGVGKTAVIKDIYDIEKRKVPLFIFKAIEFNHLAHVSDLFRTYGSFGAEDFASLYPDVTLKIVVIDSAEKLADIADKDVFREFVGLVLKYGWKIVFTTRRSYMDDLKVMLVDAYSLSFQGLDIQTSTPLELENTASQYGFELPKNDRMQDLIRNPFYLNEYLQNYGTFKADVTYSDFKKLLWDKQIANTLYKKDGTHTRREDNFLGLAKRRADQGNFFIKANGLDVGVLHLLVSDEIIGYDNKSRSYFITHDIYEEWALEKIIETIFHQKDNPADFYADLGESLPIRRAFRHWLSDKLLADRDKIRKLIEASISDKSIPSYWRDEALVSVMKSEHSRSFFELFETELLADNARLLVRVTFLLRIACKQIDETILRKLGIQRIKGITAKDLFTAPKGSGWNYVIDFVHRHKESMGLKNSNAILEVLYDWNTKHKTGETTKQASQTALFYYEQIADQGGFGYNSRDLEKKIINVVLNGSSEIKDELSAIVDEVTGSERHGRRDKYHSLAEAVLSSLLLSSEVAQAVPEKVIGLAEYMWLARDSEDEDDYGARLNLEADFGFAVNQHDYYPASTLQTPMTVLLSTAPRQAIDFILKISNASADAYAASHLSKNELKELKIYVAEDIVVTQHLSYRLWGLYRGGEAASTLLASLLMSLEKWLIDYVKDATQEEAEKQCLYLLERSNSTLITPVVISAVFSQPSKLFSIAAVLFRTKELFLYDHARYGKDHRQKSFLEGLRDMAPTRDFMTQLHQDERIKAADDEYRKNTLENLAVNYQFVATEEEKETGNRQKVVWNILDAHYAALPSSEKETDADKTWRLYLARMDRRKMRPTVEQKDGQTLVALNPEIEPELRKFSEDSLRESNEALKHLSLQLWAHARWQKEEDKYKDAKFEGDIASSIAETKEILQKLTEGNQNVRTFDNATPAYVCAVLVRDFAGQLQDSDKTWAKEVLFNYVMLPFHDKYDYQVGDGLDAAIGSLPFLIGISKEDDSTIKTYLLLILFDRRAIGMNSLSDLALIAILHHLWGMSHKDAQSILCGYLLLKPKYDILYDAIREENHKNRIYQVSNEKLLEAFSNKYKSELESIVTDTIEFKDLPKIDMIEVNTLKTAFELIPYGTQDKSHKAFLATALPILAKDLFRDEKDDYRDTHQFIDKFTNFILTSKTEEIEGYLKPFVENFNGSKNASDLLEQFISVEDRVANYDQFWLVWGLFYESVVGLSKQWRSSTVKQVIRNYLLAWQYWKETAREWHTLKDRKRAFYKKALTAIGADVTTLYSITKVLYDIGSKFTDDGIVWISDMLDQNKNLYTEDLEVNTIYHLEHVMRRYVLDKRHDIRTSPALKKHVIKVLDFLIEKASVTAYMLREEIL